MRRLILFIGVLAGVFSSCGKLLDDDLFEEQETLARNEKVLSQVASNVSFFCDLVAAALSEDAIAAIVVGDKALTVYWDNGRRSTVWPDPALDESVPPTLSIAQKGGSWIWTVNGEALQSKGGQFFPVSGQTAPALSVDGSDWVVTVAGHKFTYSLEACMSIRHACVEVEEVPFVTFRFPGGDEAVFERPDVFAGLKTCDVNRAFYKDLFLDAGIGLTNRKTLEAAQSLALSVEGICGDTGPYDGWQQEIIAGTLEDSNGRLLYPDGQPRYKLLFVNGGRATSHSKAMGETVLERMRDYYYGGGSYLGTCAGAFLANSWYGEEESSSIYLRIWPGKMGRSGLTNNKTGITIVEGSALLDYCDFGGDMYVANVRHNGGGYAETFPKGTEVLALYDYPDLPRIDKKPSVWAYKDRPEYGRIVLCGSHPEEVASGERLKLTESMIRYAMDGVGTVPLKAIMRDGRSLSFVDASERIGDLQCHHFAFFVPENAERVELNVHTEASCEMTVRLCRQGFAYGGSCEYESTTGGLSVAGLASGIWYASVQCMTTVDTEETEFGQVYSGRTDVLNGVAYSVSLSVD